MGDNMFVNTSADLVDDATTIILYVIAWSLADFTLGFISKPLAVKFCAMDEPQEMKDKPQQDQIVPNKEGEHMQNVHQRKGESIGLTGDCCGLDSDSTGPSEEKKWWHVTLHIN